MRSNIVLLLVGLAFICGTVLAEEEPSVPIEVESADDLEDLTDDVEIDVARMLSDLFVDEEEESNDEEPGANREARARGRKGDEAAETEKAVAGTEDIQKYNNFMDVLFRRLNSYMRSRHDPLTVGLAKKKGSQGSRKGKSKAGKAKKGKGKKSSGKKGRKGKNRHPKDMNLENIEVEAEEDEEEESPVEEVESRAKREVELVAIDLDDVETIEEEDDVEDDEEALDRSVRDVGEEEAADKEASAVEEDVNRKGRPGKSNKSKGKAKKNKSRKGGQKGKGKKGKGKGKGKKSSRGKGKKGGKKGNKSGRKTSSKKKPGNKKTKRSVKIHTSRAAVTGFASAARFGDVQVINRKDKSEIRTQFRTGPVSLRVSRKFGSKKDSVTRQARATTTALTGKLHIEVSKSGRAKITKLSFQPPAEVLVDGTLSRNEDPKKRSDKSKFMEKSIGRARPVIAQKMKYAARDVLDSKKS